MLLLFHNSHHPLAYAQIDTSPRAQFPKTSDNSCYTYYIMFSLFFDYTKWHYTYALLAIFSLMKEFVRFFFNLFSVTLSLQNLFRPVFSIPIDNPEPTYIGDMVATFLGGILMRLLGAFFRSLLILLGILLSMLTIIFFLVVFVGWIFLPFVWIFVIYYVVSFNLSTP